MFVIDTDPGLDDAHALAMALVRARPEVVAVTTVAGNVGLEQATRNTRWLVGQLAPEVPVYEGAARPFVGAPIDAVHIHGGDGLAGLPRWDVPGVPLAAEPAAVAIARIAAAHPGDVTVVTLGPLTNLALALRLEPRLPDLLRRTVVMGGAVRGVGNATVNAEFNVAADPVAAEAVFAELPRVQLVSWETSLAHRFTAAEMAGFWPGDSSAARLLRRLMEHRLAADPGYAAATAFGRADPLAMAVALDPACVARSECHAVEVGIGTGPFAGATAVDWNDVTATRPPVEIVLDLRRDRLLDLLAV